ncbi:MAG: Ig-like domain-containing protein [Candidatus Ozemobacteraceae bacterium]
MIKDWRENPMSLASEEEFDEFFFTTVVNAGIASVFPASHSVDIQPATEIKVAFQNLLPASPKPEGYVYFNDYNTEDGLGEAKKIQMDWNAPNLTYTLPDINTDDFPYDAKEVKVVVDNIRDTNDYVSSFTYTFTTTSHPKVIDRFPGAITNASITEPIVIIFDKTMDPVAANAGITVKETRSESGAPTVTTLLDGTHVTYSWNSNHTVLTISPKTSGTSTEGTESSVGNPGNASGTWRFESTYAVTFAPDTVKDPQGNNLYRKNNTNYNWSFTTTTGQQPIFSPVVLSRDRRHVVASFSVTVTDGAPVTWEKTKVGIVYSESLINPLPTVEGSLPANNVTATHIDVNGIVVADLKQPQLLKVNTKYYLYPWVKTQYGSKTLFFGEPVEVIVHPWNLVNNHGTGANERNLTAVNAVDNQFVIETAADLRNLSLSDINVAADVGNNLSGNPLDYLQTTYWTTTKHFIQSKNIDDVIFDNPIGVMDADADFAGTYNGQNYTVSNIAVTGNANYAGMFGNFTGASLKNLNVDGLTLNKGDLTAAGVSGGLIAAVNAAAAIDNINLNNVNVSAITGAANSAGLIGVTNDSTVTVSNVSVTFADGAGISGKSAAGLIGTAGANTSIANANVTTQGTGAITGETYASGLVGLFNGTDIDNANVTLSAALSTTGENSFVGGIAGDAAGANITRSNVTFSATVSAAATAAGSNVGGIAGNAADSNITRSNVTFAATLSAAAAGSNVGGIAGNAASANISDSNVTFDETVSTVAADSKVGGIAGNVSGDSDLTSNKVTAAKLISAAAGTSYAGGIVGYAVDTTVTVTNNSFISAVASPSHAVSAGAAAGCVAGNETNNLTHVYGGSLNNTLSSTINSNATGFAVNGNTCSCPQHTHPVNTKSNDFMAGKNHTLPKVTVTAITHKEHVVDPVDCVATFPVITLHFDKPINTATLQTAFTLTEHTYGVDGNPTDTESAVVIDGDQFTYNWEDDNQRVTVTPQNALRYNTRYTAKIVKADLKDIYGNILQAATGDNRGYNAANSGAANVEWSFTTIKGNEPKISNLIVTRDRRTVTVNFSVTNYDGSVIDTTDAKSRCILR